MGALNVIHKKISVVFLFHINSVTSAYFCLLYVFVMLCLSVKDGDNKESKLKAVQATDGDAENSVSSSVNDPVFIPFSLVVKR